MVLPAVYAFMSLAEYEKATRALFELADSDKDGALNFEEHNSFVELASLSYR